jgi:hypothetical protein
MVVSKFVVDEQVVSVIVVDAGTTTRYLRRKTQFKRRSSQHRPRQGERGKPWIGAHQMPGELLQLLEITGVLLVVVAVTVVPHVYSVDAEGQLPVGQQERERV